MVGSDDQNIILTKLLAKLAELCIKGGHCRCIANGIVAVTVGTVEINEIDKAKPVEIAVGKLKRFAHTVVVVNRADAFGKASARENIINLAHG